MHKSHMHILHICSSIIAAAKYIGYEDEVKYASERSRSHTFFIHDWITFPHNFSFNQKKPIAQQTLAEKPDFENTH